MLKTLDASANKLLHGTMSVELILGVERLDYSKCKRRTPEDPTYMAGPFIVGISTASESIANTLRAKESTGSNLSPMMFRDAPEKGDGRYKMAKTHGSEWCAWQDV